MRYNTLLYHWQLSLNWIVVISHIVSLPGITKQTKPDITSCCFFINQSVTKYSCLRAEAGGQKMTEGMAPGQGAPGPGDRRWGDDVTLCSSDRWIWTRPGTRACYSRFNGREEEARTGSHKASDIRWGQWSIFYACRVLWPKQKLILIVHLALLVLFRSLYK